MVTLPPENLAGPIPARPGAPDTGLIVTPGQSLWSIAVSTLTGHLGTTPSSREVDRYWREVVRVNLPALRSGNADLIHPGEVVLLPERP